MLLSLALSVKLLYILASVLDIEFFWSGVSVPFGASSVLLDLYDLWCGFLYNSKLTAVLYHPDIPAEYFLLLIAAGTTDPEFLPSTITTVTNSHLVCTPTKSLYHVIRHYHPRHPHRHCMFVANQINFRNSLLLTTTNINHMRCRVRVGT